MKKIWVALFAVALSSPFAFAGCGGPSIEEICTKQCNCSGQCDEKEKQNCIDESTGVQKLADEAGCGGEFDDALSCAGSLSCSADVEKACKTELEALNKCGGVKEDSGGDDEG